jgi:hypothetical protein
MNGAFDGEHDQWATGDAYDACMGRWSRSLAGIPGNA